MGIDLNDCKCESCRHGVTPLVSKSNILSKKKEIEIQKEKTEPNGNLFVFLSVLSALGAIVFTFLTIGSGMMHNGNPFPYLILTIASIVASVFTGIKAKKMSAKTARAFLGVAIVVLSGLVILVLIT